MRIYPPHIRPSILRQLHLSTREWQKLLNTYYLNEFTISAEEGYMFLYHIQRQRSEFQQLEYLCAISETATTNILRSLPSSSGQDLCAHLRYHDEIDNLMHLSQQIRTITPEKPYTFDILLIILGSIILTYGIWHTFF